MNGLPDDDVDDAATICPQPEMTRKTNDSLVAKVAMTDDRLQERKISDTKTTVY
jgi:hypothetical protein